VLLDDARPGGAVARLYRDPVELVEARTPVDVLPALERVRRGVDGGLWAAGYLAYGAGPAFEAATPPDAGDGPLLWFGLFRGFEPVADVPAMLPDPAGAWIGEPVPGIGPDDYAERFERVAALIAAGDLYQANLSFRARADFLGDPLALYAGIRARGGAGWGAVVDLGNRALVSASPELFFALSAERRLSCRPMKGTAPRGHTPAEDAALARALAADPKQRAENLMIVDLVRNDLSRVAVPGSVAVPELFTVERYPTVLQMVSAVEAQLAPGRDAVDVLAALFPCGSVTGAPKVRATEAIAEIEADARGAYTGAIGYLDPPTSGRGVAAQFSVAIRTLEIAGGRAVLGLGSGLVADSDARAEWDECLAKGRFAGNGRPSFDLIETMAFDPEEGVLRLERHLARMRVSADRLGFAFDRHAARNDLQAATFRLRAAARVRLLLSPAGSIAVEVGPAPAQPEGPVTVAVVPLPVDGRDLRLRHKTSRRGFYDAARHAAGTWEVVFVDGQGFLTEGSFTSLFVERDGGLVTPPLSRGLLPGVLRAELLETGRAMEGDLTPEHLQGRFFVGNALRGLVPARFVTQ